MTTDRPLRRAWDSCNWISLIADDEPERAEICQRILEDAEAGNCIIVASALTLAEVIKQKGQPILSDSEEQTIANFFLHEYVLIQDLTRTIGEDARRLARRYGLKPNDAVHLATALAADADVFESWNTRDFANLPDLAIQTRVPTFEGQVRMMDV